jgi:hypothetical protein
VGDADRTRDGQPEADAACGLGTQAAEGLGQRGHRVAGDQGAAVRDAQHRAPVHATGGDLDPAAGLVVLDRVVDQVPHHPLDELLVAGGLGRGELGLHGQPEPGDAGRGQLQSVLGHGAEVEQLAGDRTLIADRQRQQRLDHGLGLVDGPADAHGHVLQLLGIPARLGQRDVDGGAHDGQRGAQLVRGVRDEAALGGERAVEAFQHVVERVGELLELVLGAGEGQPLPQVLVRGAAGGLGDGPHRPQHPAGDEPAQAAGEHGHHAQADQGEQQQAVQRPLSYAGGAGLRPGGESLLARRDRGRIEVRLPAFLPQLVQLPAVEPGGAGGGR